MAGSEKNVLSERFISVVDRWICFGLFNIGHVPTILPHHLIWFCHFPFIAFFVPFCDNNALLCDAIFFASDQR